MINLNYKRLFNLRLVHKYFTDGRAPGLSLKPTARTMKVLRGARMLFKNIPNGITVLYEAIDNENTPVVPLSGNIKLTFALFVNDAKRFFNITDLDVKNPKKKFNSGNILYFRINSSGIDNTSAMTHDLIDSLRSKSFTYSFALPDTPDTVLFKLTDSGGNEVSAGKNYEGNPLPPELSLLPDDNGIYRQHVDIQNMPEGQYKITIRKPGSSELLKEEMFYADNELYVRNILGIVEIAYESDSDLLYGATGDYGLRFENKETIWKYYIIDKNGKLKDSEVLVIEDKSSLESEYYDEEVVFAPEGDAPHATIRINGMDTFIFKSQYRIPFYEEPKASIQLKKSTDDSVLIHNLPNPSHNGVVKDRGEDPESDIYVFI